MQIHKFNTPPSKNLITPLLNEFSDSLINSLLMNRLWKGKIINLQYRKLEVVTLNQVIKVNITSNWTYWCHVSLHLMRRERDIICVVSFPQIHNLSLSMWKHPTNPNWEAFCKHLTSTLEDYQGHKRQERLRNCYRL